ncbi:MULTISPECIES: TM2 domain-containing protein [Tsukamurella]|uniref:TM2 domain-containing protein n=2 Tax=Tsukamurella TaxID=2060 RepID=A0A5C5RWN3_9ACTN|nr:MULTISPECIES: TM2 domain-containing protein [Tsukamurella]NMD54058.1 hypothetical protein [Tsukamurella columbiensis]TWS27112.1 hypothetical protein FK530_20025 [Tsukamurella conjunctivitidis]
MTDPQQPYSPQQPYGQPAYQQPHQYGTAQPAYPVYPQQGYGEIASYPGYPQPGYAQPAYGIGGGYGVDPATGLPLSDKSKVAAGLLQLFLGGFGAGRFYLGYGLIGGLQLAINLVGWFFFLAGFLTLGIGWVFAMLFFMAGGLWALVDAILILTGSVKDPQGRVLQS